MPFVKLDCKILDKSIWRESPEVCKVWITLLAMADSDGLVEAAIPGIADRARVSIKSVEMALRKFQAPDKYSSNPENDGKRISRVQEGFQILNYGIYREKDYTAVVRQRRHREKVSHRDTVTAYASASESEIENKIERLKRESGVLQEKFNSAWMEGLPLYKLKYQNIDLDFQFENIIDWVKREHGKAKKSATGNLNLFFQRWLNRERPRFNKSTAHERIRPNMIEEPPARDLTPEEAKAEKIKTLQDSIKSQQMFLSNPNARKDQNAINIVTLNLARFQSELASLQAEGGTK
ncbi:MAG: hypothetical protein WC374_11490 [Phycisphaerae bacterium]|jgi:hypothetical protein